MRSELRIWARAALLSLVAITVSCNSIGGLDQYTKVDCVDCGGGVGADGGGTAGWIEIKAEAGAAVPRGKFLVASLGDRLLAVGNVESSTASETWEYREGKWSRITQGDPPNFAPAPFGQVPGGALAGATLAREARLLGGTVSGASAQCRAEAWKYSGGAWSKEEYVPPQSTSKGFVGTRLALVKGGALAIGGSDCNDSANRKAWILNASGWSEIVSSTPCLTRSGAGTSTIHAASPDAQEVLLVDGAATYLWDGGATCENKADAPTETNSSKVGQVWMTHDGTTLYLFAGGKLFKWSGSRWTELPGPNTACPMPFGGGAVGPGRIALLCPAASGSDTATFEWQGR
ncbi:MAG: hypothetical protein HYV09_36630 [Deltaproteobacteria bacterium]|nr:hypothetical protein [Deltaproteobacteria bacterium]